MWTKSPAGHGITPLAITPEAASEGSLALGLANFKPGKGNSEQTAKPPKPTQRNRPGEPKVREVREIGVNKEEEPLKGEVAQGSTSSRSSAGHPPRNSDTPHWDTTVTPTCFPQQSELGHRSKVTPTTVPF